MRLFKITRAPGLGICLETCQVFDCDFYLSHLFGYFALILFRRISKVIRRAHLFATRAVLSETPMYLIRAFEMRRRCFVGFHVVALPDCSCDHSLLRTMLCQILLLHILNSRPKSKF